MDPPQDRRATVRSSSRGEQPLLELLDCFACGWLLVIAWCYLRRDSLGESRGRRTAPAWRARAVLVPRELHVARFAPLEYVQKRSGLEGS